MNLPAKTYEIGKAAELVNIGSKTMFAELRARNVLTDRNYPLPYYVQNGYFSVDTRGWTHPIIGRVIQYHITTVLPLGMCLLSQIAQDIRAGRGKAAPLVKRGPGIDQTPTHRAA